jgi:hypothetical protein
MAGYSDFTVLPFLILTITTLDLILPLLYNEKLTTLTLLLIRNY